MSDAACMENTDGKALVVLSDAIYEHGSEEVARCRTVRGLLEQNTHLKWSLAVRSGT